MALLLNKLRLPCRQLTNSMLMQKRNLVQLNDDDLKLEFLEDNDTGGCFVKCGN